MTRDKRRISRKDKQGQIDPIRRAQKRIVTTVYKLIMIVTHLLLPTSS